MRKAHINSIVSHLSACDQQNALQVRDAGETDGHFVLAIDPNHANFCLEKGKLVIADVSPFLWGFASEFTQANRHIIKVKGDFLEHLEGIGMNPVRRYVFFLAMLYRPYLQQQQLATINELGNVQDEDQLKEMLHLKRANELALQKVANLPQIQREVQRQEWQEVIGSSEQAWALLEGDKTRRMTDEFRQGAMKQYYRLMTHQPSPVDPELAKQSAELFGVLRLSMANNINERVRKRKANQPAKPSPSQMTDSEIKHFLNFTLDLKPIPQDCEEGCFWQAMAAVLRHQQIEQLSVNNLRARIEQKKQQPYFKNVQQQWLPIHDIPLIIEQFRIEGVRLNILVIHPNSFYQATARLYQYQNGQIKIIRMVNHELIKEHAADESTLVLVRHQAVKDGEYSPTNWSAATSESGNVAQEPFAKKAKTNKDPVTPEWFSHHTGLFLNRNPVSLPKANVSTLDTFIDELLIATVAYAYKPLPDGVTSEVILEGIKLLQDFLPDRKNPRQIPVQAGDFQPLLTLMTAYLKWLQDIPSEGAYSEPVHLNLTDLFRVTEVLLIFPNLDLDADHPVFSAWKLYVSPNERRIVQKAFIPNINASGLMLTSFNKRLFFSNARITRTGHYVLPDAGVTQAHWWEVDWAQQSFNEHIPVLRLRAGSSSPGENTFPGHQPVKPRPASLSLALDTTPPAAPMPPTDMVLNHLNQPENQQQPQEPTQPQPPQENNQQQAAELPGSRPPIIETLNKSFSPLERSAAIKSSYVIHQQGALMVLPQIVH